MRIALIKNVIDYSITLAKSTRLAVRSSCSADVFMLVVCSFRTKLNFSFKNVFIRARKGGRQSSHTNLFQFRIGTVGKFLF